MKFNAEHFQKLYAEMADEELRSLDRNELNEVARACYDAEVSRRGLSAAAKRAAPEPVIAEEEVSAPEFEMSEFEEPAGDDAEIEEDDLAPAGVFTSREEAVAAREMLQAARLPAFIENDTEASGSYRLLVAMRELEHARKMLDEDGRL